jgi:hypothetical protein
MRMLIAGLILMVFNIAHAGLTIKEIAENCPGPYRTQEDMKAHDDAEICINIWGASYDGVMTALIQGATIQATYGAKNKKEAISIFDLADSSPEALTRLCHKNIPPAGILFPELFAWSKGKPDVVGGSLASGLITYLYTKYDLYQCGDIADIKKYESRINVKEIDSSPAPKKSIQAINPEVIRSRINGTFKGWGGNTIFELENGQIWKQRDYAYMYHYAHRPGVTLIKEGLGYTMIVEGVREILAVERLK